jgi:hypothetical protein
MSVERPPGQEAGISMRTMEIAVALVLLAISVIVVVDSHRLGASWGSDGPQSGYFPFYIGLLLGLSAVATLVSVIAGAARHRTKIEGGRVQRGKLFVSWDALKLVLSVLVPALVYVLGIQLIGIYIASAIYIALFMRVLGKYSWLKSVAVGVGTSVIIFGLFEIWFKVPLFKGAYNLLSWTGY